eukprot:SAG22_NODE_1296_length_4822_cov_3.066271_3_plen_237_part_00
MYAQPHVIERVWGAFDVRQHLRPLCAVLRLDLAELRPGCDRAAAELGGVLRVRQRRLDGGRVAQRRAAHRQAQGYERQQRRQQRGRSGPGHRAGARAAHQLLYFGCPGGPQCPAPIDREPHSRCGRAPPRAMHACIRIRIRSRRKLHAKLAERHGIGTAVQLYTHTSLKSPPCFRKHPGRQRRPTPARGGSPNTAQAAEPATLQPRRPVGRRQQRRPEPAPLPLCWPVVVAAAPEQ